MRIVRARDLDFANRWYHVRKTVAFTGATGVGEIGTVNVFTITGRVLLREWPVFCTENLVSAGGGSIALGVAGVTTRLIGTTLAAGGSGLVANDIWVDTSPADIGAGTLNKFNVGEQIITQDIIITVTTGDVTDGTLVFDVWYLPLTDDGALVAA